MFFSGKFKESCHSLYRFMPTECSAERQLNYKFCQGQVRMLAIHTNHECKLRSPSCMICTDGENPWLHAAAVVCSKPLTISSCVGDTSGRFVNCNICLDCSKIFLFFFHYHYRVNAYSLSHPLFWKISPYAWLQA